jgi:hypothetical protein
MGEEAEFRRRCFLVGSRVAESIRDSLETITKIKEGKTVLPIEAHKKFLKTTIDSVREDMRMAHEGFENSYPPCLKHGEIFKDIEAKLEEAYRNVESGKFDDARSSLENAHDLIRWSSLNVVSTRDIQELEYAIKKRVKGERLPWETK